MFKHIMQEKTTRRGFVVILMLFMQDKNWGIQKHCPRSYIDELLHPDVALYKENGDRFCKQGAEIFMYE